MLRRAVATQKAQTSGSINNAIAKKQFQAKQDFANLISENSQGVAGRRVFPAAWSRKQGQRPKRSAAGDQADGVVFRGFDDLPRVEDPAYSQSPNGMVKRLHEPTPFD